MPFLWSISDQILFKGLFFLRVLFFDKVSTQILLYIPAYYFVNFIIYSINILSIENLFVNQKKLDFIIVQLYN